MNQSGNTTNAVARLPQISDQMEALDSALHRLAEVADRLESKLCLVLRQEDQTGSPCAPEECLVPLADGIRGFKKRIQSASDQLESIFLRLEI